MANSRLVLYANTCFEAMLQPVSEYFCALSGEAKSRYIAKVTSSGLESDP